MNCLTIFGKLNPNLKNGLMVLPNPIKGESLRNAVFEMLGSLPANIRCSSRDLI